MEDSINVVTVLFMGKECMCLCVHKKKCVFKAKNLLLV